MIFNADLTRNDLFIFLSLSMRAIVPLGHIDSIEKPDMSFVYLDHKAITNRIKSYTKPILNSKLYLK